MKYLLFISLIIFSSCNLSQKSCFKFEDEYNKLKEDLPKNEDEIKNVENLLDSDQKEIYSQIRQFTFCELAHFYEVDEKNEELFLAQIGTFINIIKAFNMLNQID